MKSFIKLLDRLPHTDVGSLPIVLRDVWIPVRRDTQTEGTSIVRMMGWLVTEVTKDVVQRLESLPWMN